MFLKKAQVDVEHFFHERIMAVVSQELVLKTHMDSPISETGHKYLGFRQFSSGRISFSKH